MAHPPVQLPHEVASLFPHADREVIASITRHDLPGTEVYKLDSRRILESTWHLIEVTMIDSTVSLCATASAIDTYPTLDSLLVPLNAYFSILCVHALAEGASPLLPYHFFRYSSHLVKIATQYEWHAVLSYHFSFHARRCKEMRKGDFTGWGRVDIDLMEEFLVPNQKKQRHGTVVYPGPSQPWVLIK